MSAHKHLSSYKNSNYNQLFTNVLLLPSSVTGCPNAGPVAISYETPPHPVMRSAIIVVGNSISHKIDMENIQTQVKNTNFF